MIFPNLRLLPVGFHGWWVVPKPIALPEKFSLIIVFQSTVHDPSIIFMLNSLCWFPFFGFCMLHVISTFPA